MTILLYRRFFCLFIFLLFSLCFPIYSAPWGKDAELALEYERMPSKSATIKIQNSLITLAEKIIRFHQQILSPADGPRSHFFPSSSQYMLNAIHRYGFFKGYTLGCDRLMREHHEPWLYNTIITRDGHVLKWDPVR